MKVLLQGYVSNNLGDDLFFEYVAKRYPNTLFYLKGSSKYQEAFGNIANIKMLTPSLMKRIQNKVLRKIRYKYIDLYKVPKEVTVNLTIGGSIFMQNSYWKSEIQLFSNQFNKYNKNFVLGCNFGPYQTKEYVESYNVLFAELDDLCFRESYSYELFKHNSKIRYAPDIIFGLEPVKAKEEKVVFISLIKPSIRKGLEKFDDSYYEGLYSLCEKYIKDGYKIKLVSFCKKEGDEEAIGKVFNKFTNEEKNNTTIILYNGENRSEILHAIASSEIIIATRFHAMILGWIHNKKVLPIIYSNKTLNVIKDVKFEGDYIDLRSLNENYNVSGICKLENIETIKMESFKHFDKLDNYLN